MKLLVIGGTRFLGRHIAQQALDAGHQLTLLHRGRSNATLFPQARHLIADRDGDLSALQGGTWDVAIDTCGYFPRQLRSMAAALGERVGRYHFVSSISAYAELKTPGTAEDAPLAQLADPEVQTVTGDTYGGLKALCEAAAARGFEGRCLVSRPGLIVGPHDPTGRFSWWVQRFQRARPGDEVLQPGPPDVPVQFIDARDLAAWHLRQAEAGATGVFNLTGPAQPLTLGGLFGTLRDTLSPQATPVWVDESYLLAQGVAPWSDLPVWLPREQAALHQVSIARALAAGLTTRPLVHTVTDTAAWLLEQQAQLSADRVSADTPKRPAVGLAPEREAALLAGRPR
jgi:2'-hydroxyisoflavone reductase